MNNGNSPQNNDKASKGYRIIVDQRHCEWPASSITGAQIKQLAGVDSTTYDAWQHIHGPEDRLIPDDGSADLTQPGTERFFTCKKTTTEGDR